ncbi:MAG: metal-binding protein [Ruminococcaceae bacterium]|nr:metal-binding protein [Oscillospiraceae bacterium]
MSCKYFKNEKCEYFPCHPKADEEYFNCLFCFCPLYSMGDSCGGNFKYTKNGIKDCSDCVLVHQKGGYEYVIDKLT